MIIKEGELADEFVAVEKIVGKKTNGEFIGRVNHLG